MTLRTKITMLAVLFMALALFVAGLGTFSLLRHYISSATDSKLQAIAHSTYDLYFDSMENVAGESTLIRSNDIYVALYSIDGEKKEDNWATTEDGRAPVVPQTLTVSDVMAINASTKNAIFTIQDSSGRDGYRAIVRLTYGNSEFERSPIIFAISIHDQETIFSTYLAVFAAFSVFVIFLGGFLTRWAVNLAFKSLREVEQTAAAIAHGDYSRRIDVSAKSVEVARLNNSLNLMLSRIDAALQARLKTIGQMRQFVGDASHELRTPLVAVRGYAELYRVGALQSREDVAQAMDRIEKEAIRMGGMVEDLLTLARLDGPRHLRFVDINLVDLIRDAARDTTAAHPDREVTLVIDSIQEYSDQGFLDQSGLNKDLEPARIEPVRTEPARIEKGAPSNTARIVGRVVGRAGALFPVARHRRARNHAPAPELEIGPLAVGVSDGVHIRADEDQIRQVLTNLLGNAVRFSPAGSPLEMRVSAVFRRGYAMFEVVDHGEGIPEEIREKVFQRFWRADTSRARETGGSGLGLAIVSSIVELHEGHVSVLETHGGGATVRVEIPLSPSGREPGDPNSIPAPMPRSERATAGRLETEVPSEGD